MEELKNWTILFYKEDGFENREIVVRDFSEFLSKELLDEYSVNGRCRICAVIYGSDRFADGEGIITSEPKRFVRVRSNSHDTVLDMYTKSGSCYRLALRNKSIPMHLMLNDWYLNSALGTTIGRYRSDGENYEPFL